MSVLRFGAALTVLLGLAGCGGDSAEAAKLMPAVEGKQLDVALSDIKRVGVEEDDVEVLGGGTFGIRDESNWKVCEQLPPAGDAIAGKPRLTVERSCGDDGDRDGDGKTGAEEDAPASADNATTTEKRPTTTAPTTEPPKPVEEVLTTSNNADFAALVRLGDYCDEKVAQFAVAYGGRTIEFDGNVGAMHNHEGYNTRYDILVGAGDFDENRQEGPNFQFRNVAMHDLNLPPDSPDRLGVRDNVHVVAKVGEYETKSCLFLIKPVATSVR